MLNINDYIGKIVCADCMDILKELPDKCIDLVLTDPPYIMNNHGGIVHTGSFKRKLTNEKHIDFICQDFDYLSVFKEFIRICKKLNIFIFCSNAQLSRTMRFFEDLGYSVTCLVWDKPNPIPLCNGKYVSNLEFIVHIKEKGAYWNNDLTVKEKSKSFRYNMPNNRIHPTQKPISLITHLLKIASNENDLILDCFSGSGTTAVACHNLKRRFICIERDIDYYKASVERLKNAQSQLKLF